MNGLTTLLGVSTIFSALAPNQENVSYCDRYLSQQPAAIYYGDFWHVNEAGKYSYDAAVKTQFQGVMYRQDGKIITISQLKRNEAQKEIKLFLDKDNRIEKLEYRFESGIAGKSSIRTETHLFARSHELCVPLERREEISALGDKNGASTVVRTQSLRYNLQLCQEIRSKTSVDPSVLAAKNLNSSLSESLKESFVKHSLVSAAASRSMNDSTVATQALLSLHECETTAGVKEALAAARVNPQSNLPSSIKR